MIAFAIIAWFAGFFVALLRATDSLTDFDHDPVGAVLVLATATAVFAPVWLPLWIAREFVRGSVWWYRLWTGRRLPRAKVLR